jgi:aspartate ammonia-lyase
MACMQVLGFDHTVATACAAGQLELNTHMPLTGNALIQSAGILTRVCQALAVQCVAGIRACPERCLKNFETSAGLATVLNPLLGYDRVAALVKESLRTGKTLKELAEEQQLLTAEELEKLLTDSTGPRT